MRPLLRDLNPLPVSEENTSLRFLAAAEDSGTRLDAFLAGRIEGWSRTRLGRLITDGDVLVNGRELKPSYKVRENDEIDVDLTEAPVARFEPENIPLDIVYEDEYLAVINKPAGMIVHPGSGVHSGTLANALAYKFGVASVSFPGEAADIDSLKAKVGIVHRLDKDTSGLIVAAKNETVQTALSDQFRDRKVAKIYTALVHGQLRENSGIIDRPLARDRWHRTKMTVAANGRHALTLWKVGERFEKFTLLEIDIKTGRTHQIRVHLASINHPIVGDETYNEGRDNTVADVGIKRAIEQLDRFFLHAARLSFTHPVTEKPMYFEAPLPPELLDFLEIVR